MGKVVKERKRNKVINGDFSPNKIQKKQKVKGECKFRTEWLDKTKFPQFYWVRRDKLNTKAYCSICESSLDLKSMGKSRLTQHCQVANHSNLPKNNDGKINYYFNNSNDAVSDKNKQEQAPSQSINKDKIIIQNNINVIDQKQAQNNTNNVLTRYVCSEDVLRAEILYALCQVKKQASLRCFSELSDIFPLMFIDSEIAKKMKMHKDKLSYSITYGLGPYFQCELASDVRKSEFYSVAFDESLNKVAQKGQMDQVVKFWKGDEKVETRYLNSSFLLEVL